MSSPYIFWSHQLPWLTRCHCSIQAFGITGTVGWLMKNTAITGVSQFIEIAAAQLVDVCVFFFKAIASSIPISCHWLRYHKNPEYVGKMQVFNECIQRPWSGWKVDELNETRWSFQLSKPIFTVCFVTSVVKSDHPKCRKPFSFQKEPSQTCGSQGKPSNRQIFSKTMLPEINSSRLKMDDWKTTFLLGPGPFSGAFAVSFSWL